MIGMARSPLLGDPVEGEPDQRVQLDQTDADEHVRPNGSRVLGLAGHGLDRLADHDAQTHRGPDRRQAEHQRLRDGLEPVSGGDSGQKTDGQMNYPCHASSLVSARLLSR